MKIEIELRDDTTPEERAEALDQLADALKEGATDGTLYDENRLTIGTWEMTPAEMVDCAFCHEPNDLSGVESTWQQWQCDHCGKWNDKAERGAA